MPGSQMRVRQKVLARKTRSSGVRDLNPREMPVGYSRPAGSPPDQLPRLNCKVKVLPAFTQAMGSIQMIIRDPKSGALWGAGDPRADGVVFGY
jgi:gamma-glutamyltranspeptidase